MKWKIPKYYNIFEEHLRLAIALDKYHPFEYKTLHQLVTSGHTKRILFDSAQASIFTKSGPIGVDGLKLRSPFDQFYLEFTDPIEIEGQEPGYKDQLIAMVYIDQCAKLPVRYPDGDRIVDDSSFVTFIFYNFDTGEWVDRAFRISLSQKLAFPAADNVRNTPNPSEIPKDWPERLWFAYGMDIPSIPNRKIGWWEGAIQNYTNLISWLFAYMMSKSVHIEAEPVSRQVRRFHERKGTVPRPWHQVWVEPRITDKLGAPEDEGAEHSYRYDVIGHLRFNKHKIKDGSWRHTVEWVADHQRGIKNEIYIPKTYAVKKGNKPLPEMTGYFGDQIKFNTPSK